jgi:hypothetical protein
MKEHLMSLLKAGCNVNYNKISISNVTHFTEDNIIKRHGWQVHSEEREYLTSEFYKNIELEEAVARFLFLRKVVKDARDSELHGVPSGK